MASINEVLLTLEVLKDHKCGDYELTVNDVCVLGRNSSVDHEKKTVCLSLDNGALVECLQCGHDVLIKQNK